VINARRHCVGQYWVGAAQGQRMRLASHNESSRYLLVPGTSQYCRISAGRISTREAPYRRLRTPIQMLTAMHAYRPELPGVELSQSHMKPKEQSINQSIVGPTQTTLLKLLTDSSVSLSVHNNLAASTHAHLLPWNSSLS
jgi:hypothetical protein